MQEEEQEITEDVIKVAKEKNVFEIYRMYSDHLPEYYRGKQLNQHANTLKDNIIIGYDVINVVFDKFDLTIKNKKLDATLVFFVRDLLLMNSTVIIRTKFHKCD